MLWYGHYWRLRVCCSSPPDNGWRQSRHRTVQQKGKSWERDRRCWLTGWKESECEWCDEGVREEEGSWAGMRVAVKVSTRRGETGGREVLYHVS